MHIFQPMQTFRGADAALLAGISDLMVVDLPGGAVLFGVTRPGGGLVAVRLGTAGMTLQSSLAIAPSGFLPPPPELAVQVLLGVPTLMVSGGYLSRLGGYQLSDHGDLGGWVSLRGSPSGVFSAVAYAQIDGVPMHFVAAAGESVIRGYALGSSARYVEVASTPFGAAGDVQDISTLLVERFQGVPYLIALSQEASEIALFQIADNGGLTRTGRIGVTDGLALSGPIAAEVVRIGDADFIVVAAAGASSIAVLRVLPDGGLRVADLVGDTLLTRFQSVQAFAVTEKDGWVFVVAGGGDDGLTLFVILADGRLIKTGQIEQAVGLALDDVTSVTARAVAGGIEVFAAGEGIGISRLLVPLPVLGAPRIGGEGADVITGAAGQDLLFSAGGDDTLFGAAGDDILADGSGEDRLYGGDGADVFVLSRDSQTDRIEDFQPGLDRIDLTSWGRLYSVNDLSILPTLDGVILQWRDETLILRAAGGVSISAVQVRSSVDLDLWRIVPQPYFFDGTWFGTPFPDVIRGTAQSETFIATNGPDTIDGGAGFDTLDFAAAEAGVLVDLVFAEGHGGWAIGMQITGIETIRGSGFNDSLRGTGLGELLFGQSGNDILEGRGGNDTLEGGAGDDLFAGGGGADVMTGGPGADLAVYWDAPEGVYLDMLLPDRNSGFAMGDRLTEIENIWGSNFADRLVGDDGGNILSAHLGADTLEGRGGNDTLFGGAGNDTLIGGAGADQYFGGEGTDIIAYWSESLAVVYDMSLQARNSGAAFGDRSAEVEAIFGSSFDDLLWGDSLANILAGSFGNDVIVGRGGGDTLQGGEGNDTLEGGEGPDQMNGGPGLDIVVYWNAQAAVSVDMLSVLGATGDAAGDMLSQVENIWGSAFDDRIAADASANSLNGHFGNDLLFGRGGNDWLQGSDGDDTLVGGAGSDQLLGGLGRDVASFRDAASGLRVDLVVISTNTGDAWGDVFSSIEDIEGSPHLDTLVGDNFSNAVFGLDGADALQGREGNDSLYGGAGNDILIGGGGSDVIEGGAGLDLAAYWEFTTAIAADLALGVASVAGVSDTLSSVEAIWGGSGDDVLIGDLHTNHLTGDQGNDRLFGRQGADSLYGGSGADWIDGGEGDDLLVGGADADRFVFQFGNDRVLDFDPSTDRLLIHRTVAVGIDQVSDLSAFLVTGADHMVFDFGSAHRLRLDGTMDPSLVLSAIDLI